MAQKLGTPSSLSEKEPASAEIGDKEEFAEFDETALEASHRALTRFDLRYKLQQAIPLAWRHPPDRKRLDHQILYRLKMLQDRFDVFKKGGALRHSQWLDFLIHESLDFVIDELLKNAMDAYVEAVKTGKIRLALRQQDDQVIIEISDNGRGIQSIETGTGGVGFIRVRPNPTDVFRLVSHREGGAHAGFAWAQLLVFLHGGTLEVLKNYPQGYVTTMRIILPLDQVFIGKEALSLSPRVFELLQWVERAELSEADIAKEVWLKEFDLNEILEGTRKTDEQTIVQIWEAVRKLRGPKLRQEREKLGVSASELDRRLASSIFSTEQLESGVDVPLHVFRIAYHQLQLIRAEQVRKRIRMDYSI